MKQKKTSNKEKELLNTNELMPDYEFHLRMIIENQMFDFESDRDASESAA